MSLSVDWFGVLVLLGWGTLAGLAALRWFRLHLTPASPTTRRSCRCPTIGRCLSGECSCG